MQEVTGVGYDQRGWFSLPSLTGRQLDGPHEMAVGVYHIARPQRFLFLGELSSLLLTYGGHGTRFGQSEKYRFTYRPPIADHGDQRTHRA